MLRTHSACFISGGEWLLEYEQEAAGSKKTCCEVVGSTTATVFAICGAFLSEPPLMRSKESFEASGTQAASASLLVRGMAEGAVVRTPLNALCICAHYSRHENDLWGILSRQGRIKLAAAAGTTPTTAAGSRSST